MKVCTDSCLFGAWVGQQIIKLHQDHTSSLGILDIGAGSGLLDLMVAQQLSEANHSFSVNAVEIDPDACEDARLNVSNSPWVNNISIHHADIKDWSGADYDVIISNPPFFQQSLKTSDMARNTAHHDDSLSLDDLAEIVKSKLSATGLAFVLLPPTETEALNRLLHPLNLLQQVLVRDRQDLPVFRSMSIFGNQANILSTSELVIKEPESPLKGGYSEAFAQYLRPFYLYI